MPSPEDWIAATGPRAVSADPEDHATPDTVLGNSSLSLVAKGLYALVLVGQGRPVNPFEDLEDVRVAIEELVDAGLVIRIESS
ncbi:hypothetical protein [Agromyces italicus]|uniref:hypothetical protein n=1 Tax=Agromyces italicus TaxID=279572 RepID=UPI0003B4609B|nr:hypothetical protein [Agromyces italicus]